MNVCQVIDVLLWKSVVSPRASTAVRAMLEARTGTASVLILVIAGHARCARIDFDEVFVFHLRREVAHHPSRGRDLRTHHGEQRLHRETVTKKVVGGDAVEVAGAAAV